MSDTIETNAHGKRSRRWTRAAGWVLVVFGVVVSWVWSVELTILGESVNASIAGASTFLLFGAGIFLIGRVSPHHGSRATLARRGAVVLAVVAAIVAGAVPVAVTAATTGTASASVISGTNGDGYTVSVGALLTSDNYQQTTLELIVGATDRATPLLAATVSFTDGTADVTCANSRIAWTHDFSAVTLACDSFTPISSLKTVSGIAVTEQ